MLTVTRSSLSMEVADLSATPLVAACAARLYVAVADALVNDPPALYVAMIRAIREFVPVTGLSLSSIGFPNSNGNRPAPFQDWRLEERSIDGRVKQKKLGTMMAENERAGVTVEDSLRGAEQRLLEVIAREITECSQVFFHWLLFEEVGVGICLYRIARTPDDPGAFGAGEVAQVEAIAPFLARGIRLDVVFKVRASG